MDIDLQPIAPALALLGTLLVALLGFYQWKRQHSKPNRSAAAESRRRAAEALWAALEEINLRLRPFGADTRPIELTGDLRALNELFLRNSLYLDDSLQTLVNAYVKQLYEVASAVEEYQELQDESANTVPPRGWADTLARFPEPEKLDLYRSANSEIEKMELLRGEVKKALLAAIDG